MKKLSLCICLVLCISLVQPLQAAAVFDRYGTLHNSSVITGRTYSIKSFMDDRYIDVVNGLTSDGSNVWTYPYNGAACQEWRIVRASNASDEYMIMDMNSGSYLSIVASSSAEGANAWIWHDDGTSGQRFHIVNHVGTYYKFLTKCSGYTKALAVDYSTHNVYQTDPDSAYALFYLEDASAKYGIAEGKGYLQNDDTKRFLKKSTGLFTPNKIVQSDIDSSITEDGLTFDYLGSGYYRINVSDDKCLTVKNNSVSQGLTAAQYTGATGQMWKSTVSGEIVKLSPKCNTSVYLSINSSDNGHNKELKLANNLSDSKNWLYYSVEDICDNRDLTLISFSDASHNDNHLSFIDDTMQQMNLRLSSMKNVYIGYNNGTGMEFSLFHREATKSRFLIIRAHGNVDDDNGPYMILNSQNASGNNTTSAVRYYYEELPDMDDCECALFFVCHSAEGAYNDVNAINFLSQAVDECGVSYAIGFDGSVNCPYGNEFLSLFTQSINNGCSVLVSFKNAVESIDTVEGNTAKPVLMTRTWCYLAGADCITSIHK